MSFTVYARRLGQLPQVRMALDILGEPYEWREIDVLKASHGRRVPGDEPTARCRCWPSTARPSCPSPTRSSVPREGTKLVPTTAWRAPRAAVDVLRAVQPRAGDRVARFIRCFLKRDDDRGCRNSRSGRRRLAVMERHLAAHDYFAGNALTIADLALFAYTHKAADGGFDLARYPPSHRGSLAADSTGASRRCRRRDRGDKAATGPFAPGSTEHSDLRGALPRQPDVSLPDLVADRPASGRGHAAPLRRRAEAPARPAAPARRGSPSS